jgi:lipoprotein-releasing system permease protein
MPYELFLALRYLYSRRRRPMARVTALAAITGIACGVAALIVALALANGFRDEMRDKILRGTAHITLTRRDGEPVTNWRTVVSRVKGVEGVRDAAPTTYDGALLSGSQSSSYAVLRGVERESNQIVGEVRRTLIEGTVEPLLNDAMPDETPETAKRNTPLEDKSAKDEKSVNDERRANDTGPDEKRRNDTGPAITSFDEVPSEAALPGVILGAELAARTGLRVGDTGTIISGETTLTPLGLAPRYRRVRIAGIFRSGLYEYDATWVYLSLRQASEFAGHEKPAASVISIETNDIYAAGQIAERVRGALGDAYTTLDWQEANRPLFAALALERRMGLFIIALIILISTLNITTTLVLVVVERRADIAILRAMGARSLSIMCIFMIEGACIGIIGALSGIVLGLVACAVGDHYKLVSLPADVYSLSNVPFHARAVDVLLAAAVALVLSLLATIYPARAASRVRPAEALRDQ